jgi:hypothetical protein
MNGAEVYASRMLLLLAPVSAIAQHFRQHHISLSLVERYDWKYCQKRKQGIINNFNLWAGVPHGWNEIHYQLIGWLMGEMILLA